MSREIPFACRVLPETPEPHRPVGEIAHRNGHTRVPCFYAQTWKGSKCALFRTSQPDHPKGIFLFFKPVGFHAAKAEFKSRTIKKTRCALTQALQVHPLTVGTPFSELNTFRTAISIPGTPVSSPDSSFGRDHRRSGPSWRVWTWLWRWSRRIRSRAETTAASCPSMACGKTY